MTDPFEGARPVQAALMAAGIALLVAVILWLLLTSASFVSMKYDWIKCKSPNVIAPHETYGEVCVPKEEIEVSE